MTISKEERAELRELTKAADGEWRVLSPGELVFANDATNWAGSTERQEYTTLAIAAVNALPVLLNALDAADERIAALNERWPTEEGEERRKMTLSAWRPLKDAPFEGTILAKLAGGQLKLATATVVTVGFCRHGGDPGWQEAAWGDDGGWQIPDDSIVGWLPIANTYELDRAVQGEIARAFGEMIGRLTDEADCANFRHWGALAAFRDILHTSMGGRIPDEVP